MVKKRSSFECSINHLRRTAGKTGQVSFGRVGCGCRIEILGARAKRGAKTAMKPNWDKVLVGNSDPMAGRAHPPTSDVGVRARPTTAHVSGSPFASLGGPWNFSPPFNGIFFQVIFGHLWSRLVICDSPSDREIGPPNRFSDRFWTDFGPIPSRQFAPKLQPENRRGDRG